MVDEELMQKLGQLTWESLREFYWLAMFLMILMQVVGVKIVDILVRLVAEVVESSRMKVPIDKEALKETRDFAITCVILGIGFAITMSLRTDTYTVGNALITALLASALASGGYEGLKNIMSLAGYKWK